MKIQIEIDDTGAAFEDTPATEIARILRHLAKLIEKTGICEQWVGDSNGNTCGFCRTREEA